MGALGHCRDKALRRLVRIHLSPGGQNIYEAHAFSRKENGDYRFPMVV
jgi:hypothetical protein